MHLVLFSNEIICSFSNSEYKYSIATMYSIALKAIAGLAMVYLVYFFFLKKKVSKFESDTIARVYAAENKITQDIGAAYGAAGNIYYGQMKGGKYHGCGTLTFVDGSKYVGEWKNGSRDGHGTWTDAAGNKTTGQFKNGIIHKNILSHTFHGKGTRTLANGTIIHSGKWVNNK